MRTDNWTMSLLLVLFSSLWSVTLGFAVPAGPGWTLRRPTILKAQNGEEEEEFSLVRRGKGRRRRDYEEEHTSSTSRDSYYDRDSKRSYYDDDLEDDEYDTWDDEVWEESSEEEYDLFGNEIIPNPLLDSIDPDGAAERFPELARDPRFWFDIVLFLAFLDFLSFVGPRDPFPDIPWA